MRFFSPVFVTTNKEIRYMTNVQGSGDVQNKVERAQDFFMTQFTLQNRNKSNLRTAKINVKAIRS